ncbi:MAG: HAD hydrolase-like protein, partial [Oscillospiraceae bacterium]
MYKCIIFDLDGTLLNTLADLADASNFALCQMNLATHEENEYKQFVGSGRTKLVERMLPPFARTEENIHQGCVLFDSYYEKHCIDKTAPYDGIIDLLKKLKEQNILAAVVSNKPDQFATPMVKKYFG